MEVEGKTLLHHLRGQCITILPLKTIASIDKREESLNSKTCCKCNKVTNEDRVSVKDRCWHADCFECDLCKLPFDNEQYVIQEGYVLHVSCYYSLFAPRCFACGGILPETDIIQSNGILYHSQCFRCCKCQNVIKSSDTYHMTDGLHICNECYHNELMICQRCNQLIHDSPESGQCCRFMFGGRVYYMHNSCAHCPECRIKLTQDNYACESNVGLCKFCWLFSMMRSCKCCKKPILSKDIIDYHGLWHNSCFRCNKCNVSLNYNQSIMIGTTLYCERCAKGLKTHCSICSGIVREQEKKTWKERVFHYKCFTCCRCKKSIVNDECEFIDDKLICKYCLNINQ